MGKHARSVSSRVLNRILRHGRGWVFTSDDFDDLGNQDPVATVFKRLANRGEIRRLDRGLYDYPRVHPELGELSPSPDEVARAVTGRAARLQPSGAYAVNLLGLSTQVPMRVVYLTDDFTRIVKIGEQSIVFKTTTPKNMATAGRTSGLVIQALRHLGKDQVDDSTVQHLRRILTEDDRRRLLRDVPFAPAWVAKIMRQIASAEES